uniref:ATP synthase subunit a n=1 Tax=Gorgonocephalus chilensis TaxID=1258644 RepID=A0A3G2WKD4_9ECHI|nr:ATP synthase F0 subunit 6 [Gorgonocephalus chilensis]AYO99632.1 ATP synthase F0 subunit 6 [Gorgonocephalus chilensis]
MINFFLNNIFNQFIPTNIFSIPLTLIGSIIAISWIFLINNSHWINNRNNSINILKNNFFNEFLNNNTNNWNTNLFTLFLLCLSFNIISLIPYTFSQTSHLSITFSMSLPIWILIQTTGIKNNLKNKISHLLPNNTPIILIPFMIIIETISLLIQPLTLGFRLGANLLAGHLLIFLCSCTIWEITNTNPLGFLTIFLIILLLTLEIAVACIQATVFLILSKSYLEDNTN